MSTIASSIPQLGMWQEQRHGSRRSSTTSKPCSLSSTSLRRQPMVVAQEQRQWEQAEQYYQQALQIYIEYNDRYAQASNLPPVGQCGAGAAAVGAGGAVLPAGLADLHRVQRPLHAGQYLPPVGHVARSSGSGSRRDAVFLASIRDIYGV